MAWPMRRVFRAIWVIIAICLLAALPWMVYEFQKADRSVHYVAWFVAGIFVLLAIPVSIYEIAMHLEYFTRPKLQIRIIRILWMVPIYALNSWLALRFKDAQPVLDVIRECYEAYVVYNFYEYLIAYLTDELGDIGVYYCTKEPVLPLWPFNYCLAPWPMGDEFFWECKKGVLNYVIIRPITAFLTLFTSLTGWYGSGKISFRSAYLYITVVNNLSQMWSLYCLILMYMATHDELEPIRPLSKFLCIKMIIFASYWQSVVIAIFVDVGIIKSSEWTTYSDKDVGAGLQDFLICIEMFFAALAHAYAFPPRDYMSGQWQGPGFVANIRRMFDIRDVMDDVQLVASDTVLSTRDNISQAVTGTLQAAKFNVIDRPKSMLAKLFTRGSRTKSGLARGGDARGHSEGNTPHQALLEYTQRDNMSNSI